MTLALGDYLVSSLLGQGAVSQTMSVHDAERTVRAIGKRLVPRFRGDPAARAQMSTEARVLQALGGQGAPRLLGSGEDAEGPWLVMEEVAMRPISGVIGEPDEYRIKAVARVAEAAFRALGTVHEAADAAGPLHVIHGDVSPDNLLVRDDPTGAMHVDFGLASFRDAPAMASSTVRGTMRYVAPEVARGEPATQSSDVFALGLTLLHAASGEPPRTGSHLAAMIVLAAEEPVDAYAKQAARDLPPEVRDLLLAAVAFEPRSRWKNARGA